MQPKPLEELDLKSQFAHKVFCDRIKDISLDHAKALLKDIHLLVLCQESTMKTIIEQDGLAPYDDPLH